MKKEPDSSFCRKLCKQGPQIDLALGCPGAMTKVDLSFFTRA